MSTIDRGIRRIRTHPAAERYFVLLILLVVTVLLTWPLLLRPDRVYLTAPAEYYVFQKQEEWGLQWFLGHGKLGSEFIDHGQHMWVLKQSAEHLRRFELPVLVRPDITVPPTYVLSGALLTLLLPLPTVVFHNLFFVSSMFLAGLFTYLLVREILGDPEIAVLAGTLYMSSFYVFNVYTFGHTNQWQIQWIPLILYGIERTGSGAGKRSTLLLGSALALQALSSEQYTAYLSFMLPLYIVLRHVAGVEWYQNLQFWKGIGAASVLAGFVVSPYAINQLTMVGTGATETRTLQDNLYHWNVIETTNFLGVMFAADAPLQFIFRLALLLLGTVAIITTTRRRQFQLFPFAVLFIVGVSLAWGPFEPWAPYTILYKYWPAIDFFRVPYRTLPFAILGSSTLSAALLLRISEPGDCWTQRGVSTIAVIVGLQLVLVHHVLQFYGYSP